MMHANDGQVTPETQHFHFPKHISVDPVAVILGAIVVRTANRKGGVK